VLIAVAGGRRRITQRQRCFPAGELGALVGYIRRPSAAALVSVRLQFRVRVSELVSEYWRPGEEISAVQPVGGSELQRVMDRTRKEDFTRAVVQR
jgi:hypothetical protein